MISLRPGVTAESDIEVLQGWDEHRDDCEAIGHANPEADAQVAIEQKSSDRVERQKWQRHGGSVSALDGFCA